MFKKTANSVFDFFEKTLPEKTGEKPRLTQIQMAIDILSFFNSDDKCLISHAPVGIGKSYAALVPAVFHMKNRRGKIIYATHSLNLQSQIRHSELKEIKSLGLIDDYIVAKGISNYICKREVNDLESSYLKTKLLYSMNSLMEGDRVEIESLLGEKIDDKIWDKISAKNGGTCRHCSCSVSCPTVRHRERFNKPRYKVIVTNHNQLIQSVINKKQGMGTILDYNSEENIIIIDEAHYFENAAMSQLSNSISMKELKSCIRLIKKEKDEFIASVKILEREVKKEVKKGADLQERLKLTKRLKSHVRRIDRILGQELKNRRGPRGVLNKAKEVTEKVLNNKYYSWLDLSDSSLVAIEDTYKSNLRSIIQELNKGNKLIFTSGTLEINNSFEHLYFAWGGKPEELQTKSYETIFDLEKQSIVYIPEQNVIPVPPKEPTEDEFKDFCRAQYKEIKKLINITKGRTLILCNSLKQVDYIYGFMKNLDNIRILKQGEKSTELLTEEFKNDEKSVLIGSGTFFSGLSVNKKALISVILCRLPFPVPDDPFLELVSDGLTKKEAFEQVQFPDMMIKFHQAFGRLIRTRKDFGCFTILDPRAYDYDYSENVLRKFKNRGIKITRNRKDVELFIKDKLNSSFSIEYPEYDRKKIIIPEKPKEPKNVETLIISKKPKQRELHTGSLTKEQVNYYISLREKAKLPLKIANIIKRLSKDPYIFFKECISLGEKIEEETGIRLDIINEFPFASEIQEENLKRRIRFEGITKGSEVIVKKQEVKK